MTTLTPYIAVKGAAEAIAFYKRAFGATERYRLTMDDGRIGHAEIEIDGNILMISDEYPEIGVLGPQSRGGTVCAFVLDVEDVDAAFQQAIDAGATMERPLKEEPFGRGGWLFDPFGHRWNLVHSNPDFDPASMMMANS